METLLVIFLLDISDSMQDSEAELFHAIHVNMKICCSLIESGMDLEIRFRSFANTLHKRQIRESALSDIQFKNKTALFDAIIRMLEEIHREAKPSVLLIFTDGHDNHSVHDLQDLARTIRSAIHTGTIYIDFPLCSLRGLAMAKGKHRPHISFSLNGLDAAIQQWIAASGDGKRNTKNNNGRRRIN